MKRKIPNDQYLIIHLVFIIIIAGIFIYSAIFGIHGYYPVPSGSEMLTGKDTISTGLSRSFSAIMRFDFALARLMNPNGIRVFIFFFIQLLLRIFFLIVGVRHKNYRNYLIYSDFILSVFLFIWCFFPFISALLKTI